MATLRPTSVWGSNGWGAIPWGGNFPSVGGNQAVDPTAIASLQAMGTPYIVVPGIGPGAVPSQQAMGSPTMSAPATVAPAFIPSPRAIGSPSIVGPIYPGAIPSQQKMGTPFLDAEQGVGPTAIASRQAMGRPTLNFVEDIAPGAIPSRQAMGRPTMTGGPRGLLPQSIPSQQSMGIPGLFGGSKTLSLYVGGVPWQGTVLIEGGNDTGAPVTYESQNPPTITSQTLGRWTLQIDLFDTTGMYAPARGQSIVLTEGGYKLFAGCIQTVGRQRLMATQQAIIYHVVATDKSGICDRRLVKTNTYPAGTGVGAAILDIVATCLNGEGITTTPDSIPPLGTLVSDLTFNYNTVTDAFNQIGTLSGTIWYVDTNGVLWFNSFTELPAAPFNLWDNGTTTSENFRSLLIEETNVGYANIVYAISNLTIVPGSGAGGGGGGGTGVGTQLETYVLTPGNIGVLVLADGSTVYGISTTLPIGTLYSLTVNGVAQVVVEYSQWAGQEPTSAPQYGPWFWLTNATQVSASLIGAGGLPSGATVVINYTPYTTNTQATFGEALVPVDPATGAELGGCGSGIYETAIQVKNISDVDDLNAIAAAELTKLSGTPIFATFQTDKPGLMPGQIININIPNMYLAGVGGAGVNFVITTVQGIAAAAALEFGSIFQWKVTAQTSTDLGNFVQWYANLLQNASNALPVYQYEDASFVLAPGSSLAGGTPAVNPYLVKRTGLLVYMYAAAGVPPTGQDLVIEFLVNGQLVPGQVVIPGGSVPNTAYQYQFPTVNPLWVFNNATENDVVTIQVYYVVTSGDATPASNVSAYLRWRM